MHRSPRALAVRPTGRRKRSANSSGRISTCNGAGVVVFVKHSLKRLAAVRRTINAAFFIRAVRMAEHGDEQPVRVLRVDRDRGDLLAVAQAEMLPRLAAVG